MREERETLMKDVTIYTDGACRGNPGNGGYGVVLQFRDEQGKLFQKEMAKGYRMTTNNRMEILAAVEGLAALKIPCRVALYSDSQYLVNAIEKGWVEKWRRNGWYRDAKRKETAKNVDLWKRLLELLAYHQVQFHWVKGHADNPMNNRCDQLAVAAALDQSHWLEDEEFRDE